MEIKPDCKSTPTTVEKVPAGSAFKYGGGDNLYMKLYPNQANYDMVSLKTGRCYRGSKNSPARS